MSTNGPAFLQNIGDTEEERDILSPITDNPTPDESNPNPPAPESETPDAPKTPEESQPDKPAETPNPDGTPDAAKAPETPTTTDNQDQGIEFNGKKFASVEEFKNYTQQLQSSLDKVSNPETPKSEEAQKRLQALKTTPLVKPKLPSPEHYYITDDQGNKVFDIASYMQDSIDTLVIGIQQSLVEGPLAAAQFGMIRQAMLEEFSQTTESARIDKEAVETTNKIYSDFPILKTNKQLERLVSRAIDGEVLARQRQAAAEKKEYVPLQYNEISGLIAEILGTAAPSTPSSPATPDPVERNNPAPALSGRETPVKKSPIDDDIDAMFEHKKTNGDATPGNFSF